MIAGLCRPISGSPSTCGSFPGLRRSGRARRATSRRHPTYNTAPTTIGVHIGQQAKHEHPRQRRTTRRPRQPRALRSTRPRRHRLRPARAQERTQQRDHEVDEGELEQSQFVAHTQPTESNQQDHCTDRLRRRRPWPADRVGRPRHRPEGTCARRADPCGLEEIEPRPNAGHRLASTGGQLDASRPTSHPVTRSERSTTVQNIADPPHATTQTGEHGQVRTSRRSLCDLGQQHPERQQPGDERGRHPVRDEHRRERGRGNRGVACDRPAQAGCERAAEWHALTGCGADIMNRRANDRTMWFRAIAARCPPGSSVREPRPRRAQRRPRPTAPASPRRHRRSSCAGTTPPHEHPPDEHDEGARAWSASVVRPRPERTPAAKSVRSHASQ